MSYMRDDARPSQNSRTWFRVNYSVGEVQLIQTRASRITRRSAIRPERSSLVGYLALAVVVLYGGLVFAVMFYNTTFYPSDRLLHLVAPICVLLGIGTTVCMQGRLTRIKVIRGPGLGYYFWSPLMITGLTCFPFLKGLPGVINLISAGKTEIALTVSSKQQGYIGCRHPLYIEELKIDEVKYFGWQQPFHIHQLNHFGWQQPVCGSQRLYDRAHQGTQFRVRVRQSWFGITLVDF